MKKKTTQLLRMNSAPVGGALVGDHDEGNNKTVKSQRLSENEHKNHGHEKLVLLTAGANTIVTSHTNAQTGSQASKTGSKTSTEVRERVEQRVAVDRAGHWNEVKQITFNFKISTRTADGNNDSNNETVNAQDTGHDRCDHGAHHKVVAENTHCSDTGSGLGSTESGTEVFSTVSTISNRN